MNANNIKVPLVKVAHARSGDKADWVDFGLFAWNQAGYDLLVREVSAEKVQAHFAPWLPGQVDIWFLPNILAVKIVLRGALQGCGARNLRLDNLGKSMAAALLRMTIEAAPDEVQAATQNKVGWWPEDQAA